MRRRYSDRKRSRVDFVMRKHGKFLLWFYSCIAGYLSVSFLVYFLDFGFLLVPLHIVALGLISSVIFFRERQWLFKANTADLRVAIFANALTYGTEFCFIINSNGEIIYADRRFQERFKDSFSLDSLRSVLEVGNIKPDEISKFYSALGKRNGLRAYFSIVDSGSNLNLLLNLSPAITDSVSAMNGCKMWNVELDPLARPQDYFVVKATKITKEQVYESLINEHSIGMYVINNFGRIVFANKAFIKMMEIQNWESRYFSISDFALPGNADDISFKTTTGVVIPLNITTANFVDKNDSVYAFTLISPRKFAEINYYQHPCFVEAPIAAVQCDNLGNFLKVNKLFSRLFSWKPASITDIIDDTQQLKRINKYLNSSIIQDMNIDVHILKIEKECKVYLSKFPASNGFFTICYFVDITENKDLKMKLEHSQRMHAVGQLAGGIAHDFNNILTAIIGHSDLILLDMPPTNKFFNDIQQIRINANRASNLTKQLLAFSRKQTLKLDIINVADVIEGLSFMVRRIIGENICYDFLTCSNELFIHADKGQLEQVIINLVVNAYHAMEKGGHLTIRVLNVKVDPLTEFSKDTFFPDGETIENGEYVVVEVIDEGSGITQDVMCKIFDPFFSTREPGSGTGLGLSMVYGIVKQSGGCICAESKPDTGSKFTIFFPRIHAECITSTPELLNTSKNISTETGTKSILLIEDESAVRSFTKRALEREGYRIFDVSCGDDALKLVNSVSIPFDVVISDVVMPGISGPEVVAKIMEAMPSVKVIFISGYAEEIFTKFYNYTSLKNIDLLQKPFNIKSLIAKMREILPKA